jgi:hypothetical protein
MFASIVFTPLLAGLAAGLLQEIVGGVQLAVLQIVRAAAVEFVAAAFGDRGDDGAGGAAARSRRAD